jgi:aquaporin NIP
VALLACFGGPLTGASMNPARSLGPALVGGDLAQLPLYILGPCLGAALAVATFCWIRPRECCPTGDGPTACC